MIERHMVLWIDDFVCETGKKPTFDQLSAAEKKFRENLLSQTREGKLIIKQNKQYLEVFNKVASELYLRR